MNFRTTFKWLAIFLIGLGLARPAFADPLQFTNITVKLFPNLTEQLNAVTYGGSTNFLAVGNREVYVYANFVPQQPWYTTANWITNYITSNSSRRGSNLTSIASSGIKFVATGDNNWIFVATNSLGGVAWPSNNAKAFSSGVLAAACAYNSTNFVVAGEAPVIGFTNAPTGSNNWPLGTLVNVSFLESFRGATAIGTNAFGVCGAFSDIRFSTNSGLTWQKQFGTVGQPDLYSMASDGKKLIVCVGATNTALVGGTNGIIMVGTNGLSSTNWIVAYTNDFGVPISPLNAVTYTGNGFVAVGARGQVLTSSNGFNWSAVPLANVPVASGTAVSTTFNGVTFATSGFLHDVGEIVGANGNVIITAPPPPTNNSYGNEWISVGVTTPVSVGVTNTLPANTLQVTNIWGTNIVTVDWFTGPWPNGTLAVDYQGNPATNSYTFTPPFITDNSDNHTNFYWAQARDLRTGFVNTNRTLMVLTNFMRPTAAMITTNVICNGDSTTIQAQLAGNGPWTVYWTDGFTLFTNTVGSGGVFYTSAPFVTSLTLPNSAFNPTNVFLNQATNHNYQVWKLTDTFFPNDDPKNLNPTGANPSGDLTGTDLVMVNPRPTAFVVTTNTICNGSLAILQANLTGIGPWTVFWTDGFTNFTQTVNVSGGGPDTDFLTIPNGTFNPTNVFANAPTNHTYRVYAVSDSNCSANANDISGIGSITVNPRPTASLITAQTICNGQSGLVQLQADLTGLGPWTVTWSDGVVQTTNAPAGSGAVVVRGVSPLEVTNVFLNNPTNYIFTVTSVSNADSCTGNQPGDLSCTNSVTVNPRPTASLITAQTICNGQDGLVQLQADLTGLGPWTVTWSDGVVQTTNAAVGNGAVVVRGVSPLEVTNVFLNNPTNYIFTVTSVSNADSCTGNQPGDLSCTNSVTVNPRPTASLITAQTICNGQDGLVQLQADLTGLGPWTVTWSDGVVQTTNAAVGNGAVVVRGVSPLEVTNVFLNNPTNYIFTVTSVSNADSCTGNQPGDLSCTNSVTVNPRPTASLITAQTICNGQDGLVQLQADLTGLGPWTVTWSDGVVQTTNAAVGNGAVVVRGVSALEVTNVFPNNPTNYIFSVTSVSNDDSCTGNQPGDLSCTNSVTVNPRPTASLITAQTICNGGSPLLQADLTGLGPWTVTWSDGVVQTTNAPVGSGIVLLRAVSAAEATNAFPNNPTNYIFSVTSVSNDDSCTGNQPGDLSCTNTVTVNPRPTASLITAQAICNGQSALVQLQADLTGLGPWTVTWSDGVVQTTNAAVGNGAVVVRGVTPGEVNDLFPNNLTNCIFTVTSVSNDDSCLGNLPGDLTCTNTVTVSPLPTASLVTTQTVCNGDSPVLQANLTGLGPWTVTWSDGVVQTTNAPAGSGVALFRVVSAAEATNAFPNNPTNYLFTVTSVSNADSCTGNQPGDLTCSNFVNVNPRPTASLVQQQTICNGQSATVQLQADLTGLGPWTVKWSDGFVQTTNAGVGSNAVVVRGVTPLEVTNIFLNSPTNYAFWVTSVTNADTCAGNQPGDLTSTNTITVNPRPTSTLSVFTSTNCNDGSTTLLTNVLTGIGPWTVTWSLDKQIVVESPVGAGPGPFTNIYTVFPTNSVGASTTSNNVFFVTSVSDTTSCLEVPKDITGTNTVVVLPLAVIPTNGFVLGTNDFLLLKDFKGIAQTSSHAKLNSRSTDSAGDIFLGISFATGNQLGDTSSNYLYITNHLVLVGASPWTVTMMEVGADLNGANTVTNFFTKTFNSSPARLVITNVIFDGTEGTNFTISVASLDNSNCASIQTTNAVTVFINASPSVDISIVGPDPSQNAVCSGTAVTNEVDLVGGTGPWTVWWQDGLIQSNSNSGSIFRVVTNLNIDASSPLFTNYWITNLLVTNLFGHLTTNALDTNAALVQIIVDPVLDVPPTSSGDLTSCYDVAVPLSVSVPAGYTVDWYTTNMSTLLATGTVVYVPPVPVNLGGNPAVTNFYLALARYVDTNLTDVCYSPGTNIMLISLPCTNTITSIIPSGTNVLVSWTGNYLLQGTTNLLPPINWVNIYTGAVGQAIGPNIWTNSDVTPPADMFFRLSAPTN